MGTELRLPGGRLSALPLRTDEHPAIRPVLKELYESSQSCLRFVGFSIVAGMFILPFFGAFPWLLIGFLWLLAGVLAIFCVSEVVRSTLVFFCFLKYSLAQLLKVVLAGGLLGALGVVLPWPFCVVPYGALLLLAGLTSAYVLSYDPVAKSNFIPPTAREALFNPPIRRYPRPSVVLPERVEACATREVDLVSELRARRWTGSKPLDRR